MAIWPSFGHMAIQPYCFMALNVSDMGVCGKSIENFICMARFHQFDLAFGMLADLVDLLVD